MINHSQKQISSFIHKVIVPAELKKIMVNAKRQGRDDVYWFAFKHLCKFHGQNETDPLHLDFYEVLTAYEELLTEKNGRTTKANRTRQKLSRHSVEKCLEDWALSVAPTQGFLLLIAKGMHELTAEYFVLKYKNRFSQEVIASALKRLQDAELDTDAIMSA